MKSTVQLLAGIGTAFGAAWLDSGGGGGAAAAASASLAHASGTVPLLASSAVVALNGLAGSLLWEGGSNVASSFRDRLSRNWSPFADDPEVARSLWASHLDAVDEVLSATIKSARREAARDSHGASRWTLVVKPFGVALAAELKRRRKQRASPLVQSDQLQAALHETMARWNAASAETAGLFDEVAEAALIDVADALGRRREALPEEFVARFLGRDEAAPGWMAIFLKLAIEAVRESKSFGRAWDLQAQSMMLLLLETFAAAGEPPLDVASWSETSATGFERFVYTSRWTVLRGRVEELARISEFARATDPADFRFAHVYAGGGHGKSRLALEACRSLVSNSKTFAGFLPRGAAPRDGWDHWQPKLPTFIVVDYASDRAEEIGAVIRSLSRKGRNLTHPVRLLLLSREGGLASAIDVEQDNVFSQRWSNVIASGSTFEETAIRNAFAWELELTGVDEPWQVMLDVFHARDVPLPDRELALEALELIDPRSTPLFAILVADALAAGEKIVSGDRLGFLQRTIRRQASLPADRHEQEVVLNMAALATLTRGLDVARLADHMAVLARQGIDVSSFRLVHDDIDPIIEFVARLTGRRDGTWLHGLEPDLLGEALIVSRLNGAGPMVKRRCDLLRDLAWWTNDEQQRSETAVTELLTLLVEDFPDPVLASSLLHRPRASPNDLAVWASFIGRAIRAQVSADSSDTVLGLVSLLDFDIDGLGEQFQEVMRDRIIAETNAFIMLAEWGQIEAAISLRLRSVIWRADYAALTDESRRSLHFYDGSAAVLLVSNEDYGPRLEFVLENMDYFISSESSSKIHELYIDAILRCFCLALSDGMRERASGIANQHLFSKLDFFDQFHGSRGLYLLQIQTTALAFILRRDLDVAAQLLHVAVCKAPDERGVIDPELFHLRTSALVALLRLGFPSLNPSVVSKLLQAIAGREPPRTHIVFFDWRRAVVTPEGMAIVRNLATGQVLFAADTLDGVALTIAGHVDASEELFNSERDLAGRRAQSIARAMASYGIPYTAMRLFDFSGSKQLVETMAGVREPQNRRAEMTSEVEDASSPEAFSSGFTHSHATADSECEFCAICVELLYLHLAQYAEIDELAEDQHAQLRVLIYAASAISPRSDTDARREFARLSRAALAKSRCAAMRNDIAPEP